jgi:hypothetical protein
MPVMTAGSAVLRDVIPVPGFGYLLIAEPCGAPKPFMSVFVGLPPAGYL